MDTFGKNKQMEIGISRMANNGKGIGTAPDGKTVFVSGAVPGDRLLAEITAEKDRLYEARIIKVLSSSPDRVASDCPDLDRCGGCCFRQMTYEREQKEKEAFVKEAFRRIGRFDDLPAEPILASPQTEAYRNKVEFAIGTEADGKLFAGFFSEKTHQVIPVGNCLLIPDEFIKISEYFLKILNINKISKEDKAIRDHSSETLSTVREGNSHELFPAISGEKQFDNAAVRGSAEITRAAGKKTDEENFLKKYNKIIHEITAWDQKTRTGSLRQLILRKSSLTGEILLCIVTAESIEDKLADAAEKIRREFPCVSSVCTIVNRSSAAIEPGRSPRFLSGSRFIRDQICGVPVEIGPLSFFQVNTPAAEELYHAAAAFADVRPDDVVLDLYCGMGTIGLSIASGCRQLIGAEIISEAVESAKHNAAAMGLDNTRFLCGDAGKIAQTLIRENMHPDLIILDPPRRGCSPETLQAVLTLNPGRIVMVSCDPATAARDCRTLCDNGCTLTHVRPVDLFPRTKHVETVVLMSRIQD